MVVLTLAGVYVALGLSCCIRGYAEYLHELFLSGNGPIPSRTGLLIISVLLTFFLWPLVVLHCLLDSLK